MPSQWTIMLDGPADPDIPAEAPHAVVSRWLDEDHTAAVKPYSIAPPSGRGRRTVLRVCLLDDALAGRLAAHATVGAGVRLGRHHFTVTAPPVLEHGRSWVELSTARPGRAWDVSYLSPVAFRRRNRTSPWPAPDSVLTGLSARWQVLDPVTAPTVTREVLRSVWVADVSGSSQVFTLKDTIVSGFVGRLRYVCDGSESDAAVVSALFAFARYAGVGSHTAFGLGTVHIVHARPPHIAHPDHDTTTAIGLGLDQPPRDGVDGAGRTGDHPG